VALLIQQAYCGEQPTEANCPDTGVVQLVQGLSHRDRAASPPIIERVMNNPSLVRKSRGVGVLALGKKLSVIPVCANANALGSDVNA
jgi:hypothetical protein